MRFLRGLLFLIVISAGPPALQAALIPVGAGSYTDTIPGGWAGPVNNVGTPVSPFVTASFSQIPTTNKWWSLLLWKYYNGNNFGQDMYPWPWAVMPNAQGLQMRYVDNPSVTANDYHYFLGAQDFTVSVAGLNAPDVRVDRYGDWDVTAVWDDGLHRLKATLGNGFVYGYFETQGGAAQANFVAPAVTLISNVGATAVAQFSGRNYAFFGPSGSTWTLTGTLLSNSVTGPSYFSVAILPDTTPATLAYFQAHAFAFPTQTRANWVYTESSANLDSTFTVATVAKEGGQTIPLQAIFRHQWLNSSDPLSPYTYVSARGTMKVLAANSFSTRVRFNGVLPQFPSVGTGSPATLYNQVDCYYSGACGILVPTGAGADTYAWGKYFGRLSELAWLANEAGHSAARAGFVKSIELGLQDWFTAAGGVGHLFYYDNQWKTLIGYPAGFGSNTDINDHHFHYGYFVRAFSTIARFDPTWWASSGYQGMAREVLGDVANDDRTSTRYPFLRNFSPYEGLFWANGHAQAKGNDNESSSEAMDLAGAIVLLGSETGDKPLRDAGIFAYVNAMTGIEQYWLDVNSATFPAGYNHKTSGITFGNGVEWQTYFSPLAQAVHMIQFLPITTSNIYLGRNPSYMQANINEMLVNNPGPATAYKEIIWGAEALYDPTLAITNYNADSAYTEDDGSSKANTYHWMHFLECAGQLDTSVTADGPNYNVFNKAGARTYAGYNPSNSSLVLNFSDGHVMSLAAKELKAEGACVPLPTPTATPCNGPLPTTVHLLGSDLGGVVPDGHWMRQAGTGASGSIPNQLLSTNAIWYSDSMTGSFNAGPWNLQLWSDNSGGTANVSVILERCDLDGSNPVPILSTSVDLNAGGGNHINNVALGTATAVNLVTQRLRLKVLWLGPGTNYNTLFFNGGTDFDSKLTGPGGAGACPMTSTQTCSPSQTPTQTATASDTSSPTSSPTATPSPTFTGSASSTVTGTLVPSASATTPPTASPTSSWTPTLSASATLSDSSTVSTTPSCTPTITPSPTISPSFTVSPTPGTPTPILPVFLQQKSLLMLHGLYPNPFADKLSIYVTLRVAAHLRLNIYNVAGEIIGFYEKDLGVGKGELTWDGSNQTGARCASGVYPLWVQAEGLDKSRDSFWALAAITR